MAKTHKTLSASGQKARYGISYLRNICAHAGVGLTETSPDEDVLAVDCDVSFPAASVRVQVKCTSSFKIGGYSASWSIKPQWREKWQDSAVPVYFVIVIVPSKLPLWLDHNSGGTFHHTAAFWSKIDASKLGTTISVPKSNRLTMATLPEWNNDLLACFTSGGAI